MSVNVTVTRSRTGLGRPETAALVKKAIAAALSAENVLQSARVDVLLTDDETIREINFSNRGIDRATDVLSFPLNELIPGEFDPDICEVDFDTDEILLGDMVISIPRCLEQGEEYGHGYKREVCYLAVHSVLHLLGYDHVDEGVMKAQMRKREKEIMLILGI